MKVKILLKMKFKKKLVQKFDDAIEEEEEIIAEDHIDNEVIEGIDNESEDDTFIEQESESTQETTGVRRRTRETKLPERLGDFRIHLHHKEEQEINENAKESVLAIIMCHLSKPTRMISKKMLSNGSNI